MCQRQPCDSALRMNAKVTSNILLTESLLSVPEAYMSQDFLFSCSKHGLSWLHVIVESQGWKGP